MSAAGTVSRVPGWRCGRRLSRRVGAGGGPAARSRRQGGGLPAGPRQVEVGREAEASGATFSEVLRVGWKAAGCYVGASDSGGAEGAGGEEPWGCGPPGVRRRAGTDPQTRPYPHSPGGGVTIGTSRPRRSRPRFRGSPPWTLDVCRRQSRWDPLPFERLPPPRAAQQPLGCRQLRPRGAAPAGWGIQRGSRGRGESAGQPRTRAGRLFWTLLSRGTRGLRDP